MLAPRSQNRVLLPYMGGARRPAGASLHTLTGATMGTGWTVKIAAARPDMTAVGRAVSAALQTVVSQMSPWIADSNLNRFNRAPAGAGVEVPEAMREVLDAALAVARQSDGAFDPTLGELTGLWGFGPTPAPTLPPSNKAVEAARARSGWTRLAFDGPRLIQPGGLSLDLCGIAKGYAVDRIDAALDAMGISSRLVEIGGELRGAGLKPNGEPWWVEIERPPGAAGARRTLAGLHNLAVATSGNHRRFFDHRGRRFCHTLDPRTGRALAGGPVCVSVLHRSAMLADALATALTVMSPETAMLFCETHDVAASITPSAVSDDRLSPALIALL